MGYIQRPLQRLAVAALFAILAFAPGVAPQAAARQWTVGARSGDGDAVARFRADLHTTGIYVRRQLTGLPAWLDRIIPDRLGIAAGVTLARIRLNHDRGTLVAFGPVLIWEAADLPIRFTVGFQPGIISDHEIDNRHLGGPLQFTSHVAAGVEVTERVTVGLRLSHTSNANLYRRNTGLDVQAIEADIRF